MHRRYTSFLWALQCVLAHLDWYGEFIPKGEKLKRKTLAIVTFDREIILAQRMFDAAQSTRNSPITGDSNDMSVKQVPAALSFNGYTYRLDLSCNPPADAVAVKSHDSESVGSIKYKLELDTSEVDARLEKVNSLASRTSLARDLVNQALIDPAPFTLQNNGTINLYGAAVGDDSLEERVRQLVQRVLSAARKPGGALWDLINK